MHVKVDTGMHRVGAAPEDLAAIVAAVVAESTLELEGVWTHLPVADGEDPVDRAFTTAQLALFERLVADLEAQGVTVPLLHAANTAGTIAFPRARLDMVRCGLGLYGYLPGPSALDAFAEQAQGETLLPAMSLEGPGRRRAHARRRRATVLRAAAPVARALGRRHRAHRLRRRGAAGALPRWLQRPDRGSTPAAGRDGHHGPDRGRLRRRRLVRPGDEVVLLGRQGDETITADDWAELLGTISYEVVCGVGPRMPRILVNRPDRTR